MKNCRDQKKTNYKEEELKKKIKNKRRKCELQKRTKEKDDVVESQACRGPLLCSHPDIADN